MPQFAPLEVHDGSSPTTPTLFEFKPDGFKGPQNDVNGYRWRHPSGIRAGDMTITTSLRTTTKGNQTGNLKLTMPTLLTETNADGVTEASILRTAYAELKLSIPNGATFEEKRDLLEFVRRAIHADDEQTYSLFVLNDPIY